MSGLVKLLGQKRPNDTKFIIEKMPKKAESISESSDNTQIDTKPVIDANPITSNTRLTEAFADKLNPKLPIYRYADEINAMIKCNQVIVIAGRTGCGKTTQVPQIIFHDGEANKVPAKILITQPRRIAAVSIAKRLSFELGAHLGDLVGYHVGMNPYYSSERSKIIIKTTGIFLEELIHEKSNMNNYTHLILDEVHERDINIDFVLVLVKHFLSKNSSIKLILMSATISTDLFSNYFSRSSILTISERNYEYAGSSLNSSKKTDEDDFQNSLEWNVFIREDPSNYAVVERKPIVELTEDSAPVLEIKHQVFKLHSFFLDDITNHIKGDKGKLSHLHIKNFAFSFSKKQPFVDDDLFLVCLNLVECIHFRVVNPNERINNSVLIFLPGYGEILAFMAYLKDHFSKMQEIEILMLHSNISDEEQEKVFVKTSKRKIILATNIAESSITIDDTCYVIDFCLVKELQYSCKTNHETLELRWASKANCLQRAGRAGRTSVGYAFRLVTSKFYDCLDDFPSPEILRAPLEKVILKIKVYDCGEPSVILGRSIQPPELKNIESAILNLKNCGALTVEDPKSPSGLLTELGKVYAELPIDIKYSRLIMLSCAFGLAEVGIISAAILSQEKRLFKLYDKSRRDLYRQKNDFGMGSQCDIISNYNAYIAWEKEFGLKLRRNQYDRRINRYFSEVERLWCINHCLDFKLLREVLMLSIDIRKRLTALNVYESIEVNPSIDFSNSDTVNLFKYVIAGAFYGKIIKSKFYEIERIKKLTSQSTTLEHARRIQVKGIPLDFNEKIIKNLFRSFGTMTDFEYKSQEATVGYDPSEYKEAIKLILFAGSNSVFNNRELQMKKEGQEGSVFLRKPNYLFELIHYDLFSNKKVEMHKESINHIVVESDESLLPLIYHVCDEYVQKETKATARYVTKLPEKPMIDLILTLIFTPYAKFYPNEARNQYKSFKVVGNETEFILNYLFSSIDVKEINAIRRILNKLVKTKDAYQTDFGLLRKQLVTNINALVNKSRIKIISRDNWNRLFFQFYPELKMLRDSKFMFFPQDSDDSIKFSLNQPLSSKAKEGNDFLEPLTPLNIKEDLRLWTVEGLAELELERKKFNTMRDELLERISKRKSVINHTEPDLYCAGCSSYITSINNITEENLIGHAILFKVGLWGKTRKIAVDDPSIQTNPFVMEWRNNYTLTPKKFLKCYTGAHIIGIQLKKNCFYISPFSDLYVNLPGQVLFRWNEELWSDHFKLIKAELPKANDKRVEYIHKELDCELCHFHCANGGEYLVHLETREHVRLLTELQEEIF